MICHLCGVPVEPLTSERGRYRVHYAPGGDRCDGLPVPHVNKFWPYCPGNWAYEQHREA